MKAFLTHRDKDFDLAGDLPPNAQELVQDLEIDTLLKAMAGGDAFLFELTKKAVLVGLKQPEDIMYRQQILVDCMEHPDIVREMYRIAVESIEREKRVWHAIFGRYPEGLLHRSVEVLQLFVVSLKKLRAIADGCGTQFRSAGFRRFFGMLTKELDDEYLSAIEEDLRQLAFRRGILMSAELGEGNKGAGYILRKLPDGRGSWMQRVKTWLEQFPRNDRSTFVYQIDDRDESGQRALTELKGRGISQVAIALGQSTDHILSFLSMLRVELGFYVGCLNLRDLLARKAEPICFPEPLAMGKPMLSARGLYDVCLSLIMEGRTVGNDIRCDGKLLVMITGANRGGKSTLLRSVGVAQLMMECGMFLPAESFCANVCNGIYTHFKRAEDASMRSGKLDEELGRMSVLVDNITPNSIVLLNESFASTNEREGSEIARQIVRALLDSGIKVFYVTHMFDLAQGFYEAQMERATFLRAERLVDGQRPFRLIEAEPLPTSYGEDLYARIFGPVCEVLSGNQAPDLPR